MDNSLAGLLAGIAEPDALALLRHRAGIRIALVGRTHLQARTEFLRIARAEAPPIGVRIGAGSEAMEWPSGSRLFIVANPRGYRLDAVLLAPGTVLPRAEWAPALHSSRLLRTVELDDPFASDPDRTTRRESVQHVADQAAALTVRELDQLDGRDR